MRTLMIALVVSAGCVALGGCITFDEEHNETFIHSVKTDIRVMHEDVDWILAMDKETELEDYYR